MPAPVAFGAPVLITDCVSGLAGDTVLGLLWLRLGDPKNKEAPEQ